MIYSKEITNIKEITKSYKSCKFVDNGSCILEARFGKLTLIVPAINSITNVIIRTKKISGNGKITINGHVYNVQSKNVEELDISLHPDILDIQRPLEALGEVAILGLIIYFDEEVGVKKRWKNIIAKCGSYQSIRLVKDRLYAANGAFFQNGSNIEHIETVPPGMSYSENGMIKFSGSCEIIDIITKGEGTTQESFHEFNHMEMPGPNIFPPSPNVNDPFESRLIVRNNMPPSSFANIVQSLPSQPEGFMNVLYNSDNVREFNSAKHVPDKTGLTKYLKSNGKDYLVIKRGGSFTIPISNIKPNSEYLVEIIAQRLNGNGKLHVGTFSNNIFVGEVCIIENITQNKSIKISTSDNSFQKLQLRITEDGVGEILISKITVSSKNPDEVASLSPVSDIVSSIDRSAKKFVIVIPSYKNANWCDRNIQSVIDQNYSNYRVIYTDDNSPDETFSKVSSIVKKSNKAHKFTLIKNDVRLGALHNLYNMITSCEDDEIILTLDGDDWLSNENVLNTLNQYYSSEDIWMTYGQYQNHPNREIGIARQIPDEIINTKSYRKYSWCSSHLRTFYAWLFKKIKLEDLKYQNEFMAMAWDMTIMFPMLEMSGHHSRFISDILYIYNLENPINDHKVNVALQQQLDKYVRNMPLYNTLPTRPIFKTKIGLLIIATGRYDKFVPGLIASADNYFMKDSTCQVTYYLFTDKEHKIKTNRDLVQLYIEHKKFPFASMDRFKNFTKYSETFNGQDYLYYIDVDCLFVDHVSKEILGDLVGVRHCGFFNRPGPYENNPDSIFYVKDSSPKKYKYYFGGGFSGGRKQNYLALAKDCSDKIEYDVARGIIPLWHDETAINKYFLDHEPTVILNPSYHYPQANEAYYKEGWAPYSFSPKILLLDKNHGEIRK